MIKTLHGQTVQHSNLLTDIRIAKETGYEALEIITPKLLRYLNAGLSVEHLALMFKNNDIIPACIDIIGDVETTDPKKKKEILELAKRLCSVAKAIHCPTIQLNAFCGLQDRTWKDIIKITAENIAEIADIGIEYGIRFQYEGAAWTPIQSLEQCMELLAHVDRYNVGLVIDFWHFWAGRETEAKEIASLDANYIYGVHLCDGKRVPKGEAWKDERLLRGFYPGEGELPVDDYMSAIKKTGFNGFISGEIMSESMWEIDNFEIALEMRRRMEHYL